MAEFRLDGKRCIVTGGGSGIGRGITLELARAGARVAVTGRRAEPLRETVALCAREGAEVLSATSDVTDPKSVEAGFQKLAAAMDGGVDVLVANAGIGGPNALSGPGPERWDAIVRTNLDGVFHCARAALRRMPDGGRIVAISSVLGKFGVPGYTAYCASKHGVIGLVKALALEVAARGITVNAVCPGWVETEMAHEGMENLAKATGVSYEEARRSALSAVPIGRILEPEEIGALVVYLASDAASGLTAQALSICGGQVMNG
jgi:ketoreductase